jgi:outer membrane protein assembly factor BamB
MKTRFLLVAGVLLALALFLGGCASGGLASAWPGVTADAQYAYVAGGAYVYAVDLNTGLEVWHFPEKGSVNAPFFATPALTPDGQQLIVGGYDRKLYSLNPQTGVENWKFEGASDRWIAGAVATEDTIFAANADYNLYAIEPNDGSVRWKFAADQSIWGTPVFDGTNIYFGTLGRKVYAVNARTGQQVWAQTVDGAVLGTPALGEGAILFVGTYGGTLYALNTADGQPLWSQPASSWIWSGPALDDGGLVVGDGEGNLYAYPASDGAATWTQKLDGAVIGTPLVVGNLVVVGTETERVYLVDRGGASLRPVPVSGKVYASPVAAGDLILIAPTEGDFLLLAFNPDGSQKWSFQPASK